MRVTLLPRQPYEARYVADRDVIGFAFEGQQGVHALGSDRVERFRTRPNSLSYLPQGCDVFSRSDEGGEYLLVHCPPGETLGQRRFNDRVVPEALRAAVA